MLHPHCCLFPPSPMVPSCVWSAPSAPPAPALGLPPQPRLPPALPACPYWSAVRSPFSSESAGTSACSHMTLSFALDCQSSRRILMLISMERRHRPACIGLACLPWPAVGSFTLSHRPTVVWIELLAGAVKSCCGRHSCTSAAASTDDVTSPRNCSIASWRPRVNSRIVAYKMIFRNYVAIVTN